MQIITNFTFRRKCKSEFCKSEFWKLAVQFRNSCSAIFSKTRKYILQNCVELLPFYIWWLVRPNGPKWTWNWLILMIFGSGCPMVDRRRIEWIHFNSFLPAPSGLPLLIQNESLTLWFFWLDRSSGPTIRFNSVGLFQLRWRVKWMDSVWFNCNPRWSSARLDDSKWVKMNQSTYRPTGRSETETVKTSRIHVGAPGRVLEKRWNESIRIQVSSSGRRIQIHVAAGSIRIHIGPADRATRRGRNESIWTHFGQPSQMIQNVSIGTHISTRQVTNLFVWSRSTWRIDVDSNRSHLIRF